MRTIDLNADLGEAPEGMPAFLDDEMLALVSSASIACGGHAGDAASMRRAVAAAAAHGVAVGAHPSYPDRAHFGRRSLPIPLEDLEESLVAQLHALLDAGADLRYVKPHGALYHDASDDPRIAFHVQRAVQRVSGELGRALPILGQRGELEGRVLTSLMPFSYEAFLDRGYDANGWLVPRGEPGALLDDPAVVARRAVRLATEHVIDAVDGTPMVMDAASFCLHGDTPGAVEMAHAVRAALDEAGVVVRAPW
jgi:UPF0271 protein